MARTTTLVIDASVALKWFLVEENTEIALQLREQLIKKITPIVPSLFLYEISNVLRYKKEFGIHDVLEALASLEKFQFKIEDFSGDLAKKSVELAFTYGITIYDASYIALSQISNTDLITADEKLMRKVSLHNIIALSTWPSTY